MEFQLFLLFDFPCEIFGMEGNYILFFLDQEIVFILGDPFLHALMESDEVCLLETE